MPKKCAFSAATYLPRSRLEGKLLRVRHQHQTDNATQRSDGSTDCTVAGAVLSAKQQGNRTKMGDRAVTGGRSGALIVKLAN
jgi:hypothetical protein